MGRGGTVGRNQRHGEAGPSEMGQGDEGDTGSDKSVTAEALCHHRAGQGRAREQGSPRAGPRRGTAQGQDFRERAGAEDCAANSHRLQDPHPEMGLNDLNYRRCPRSNWTSRGQGH